MNWDELTTIELASLPKSTPVILATAATEQHGPHLPLATDRLIAEHFVRLLNDRFGKDILTLPTVSVGCSEHHLDFAGTLSLRHEVFIALLTSLLESAVFHGFTNVLILNSHGGNMAAAQVAVEAFGQRHPSCQVMLTSWWQIAAERLGEITETGPGGVGHACEFETSLLLRAHPELVRQHLIQKAQPHPTFPWAEGDMLRRPKATLYRSFQQMTDNGVYGDPSAASAGKGEGIERAVLEAIEQLIVSLRSSLGSQSFVIDPAPS